MHPLNHPPPTSTQLGSLPHSCPCNPCSTYTQQMITNAPSHLQAGGDRGWWYKVTLQLTDPAATGLLLLMSTPETLSNLVTDGRVLCR